MFYGIYSGGDFINYLAIAEKYRILKERVGENNLSLKESFNHLIDRIENETNYLECPASARYHGCYKGGLLEHVVSVASIMLKIKKDLAPEISDDDCIIVALLHDLGKVGYPGSPQYLENKEYNPNRSITNYNSPYNYNDKIIQMPHAHRSVYLIQNFGFQLTPEQYQAIIAHDGMYIDDNVQYKLKECKLLTLLHYSDLWDTLYVSR